MTWVFAIVVVLAMGGVAMVAAGRGGGLMPTYDDRPDSRVATGRELIGGDLREVRFSLGLRGYRMTEVDSLLDRLADQLDRASASEAIKDEEAARSTEVAAEPLSSPESSEH